MEPYEKQMQTEGSFAAIVWLVSGIYLFWASEKASFLSWQAALYFIVGMFVVAILFGICFYGIQRGISKVLAARVSEPSRGIAGAISVIGLVLMVAEAVVIFLVARWVVQSVLF